MAANWKPCGCVSWWQAMEDPVMSVVLVLPSGCMSSVRAPRSARLREVKATVQQALRRGAWLRRVENEGKMEVEDPPAT